jgi:hypothetical protein
LIYVIEKTTPFKGRPYRFWCRGRDLNPHGPNDRMALNHVRLPIPPPRQLFSFVIFAIYYTTRVKFRQEPFCFFAYKLSNWVLILSIKNERMWRSHLSISGAGDGFRTRDPLLGKQVLYR